ncbi:tetraprenyl-beta-curcumene synthase family protein [Calderihabitans maritimus]|uniref:Tetraprenyl-beta-curcumene synthase n=1 Tax=Calderihabitans maritimus TaxID=1246530 RepID=A0A1Z5HMX6_9FIRM|nr:tetraprenyl-beta-curcumene synthase family protein [Calderihabitans maritimus]GAW90864.1 hypothetical protein KKC1_00260 [Calderihabitans maritimus]
MAASLKYLHFPSQLALVVRFVKKIFPLVETELSRWYKKASLSPDPVLAEQAHASIKSKRFHAQGGSIYALYPGVNHVNFTRFVVALQTISDYLDNLCDRLGYENEKAFSQLHRAMTDALNPSVPMADYYAYFPHRRDGGYLEELVRECRRQIASFPSYALVKEDILDLAELYSNLQTLKHLPLDVREDKMIQWTTPYLKKYTGISRWEFAAATGSTLGIFVLSAAASNPHLTSEQVARIKRAYFPWICGLHILLDYLIDLQEDRLEGDLNFVSYYRDNQQCKERLNTFLNNCFAHIVDLPHKNFHATVIIGLLAMYLSDPKASDPEVRPVAELLLKKGGKRAALFHRICCFLRQHGTI